MTASMPDDYYKALGVPRDATSSAIKLAYRKLVLKHHPDKVEDAEKAAAADKFHKIQTAWEALGDDDKRMRYDAQVKLATLRNEKELAERERERDRSRLSTPDYRPSPYRSPSDVHYTSPSSPRAPPPSRSYSYRAVEVQPPFDTGSFDRSKPSERKDFDYDQDRRRRTPPREDRPKVKLARQESKESERARHREKGRQTTKATNRDRDTKYSNSRADVRTDSESDDYFDKRSPRDPGEEDRARERYMDKVRQQAEEARSNQYMHERTQQIFSDAQDYQQRMRSTKGHAESRRPSPTRKSSSRENLEYFNGRPANVRRTSHKPPSSSRDDVDIRGVRRGGDRDVHRSSNEYDEPRRPPSLSQTKSAPNEIRIPFEKQRSSSVQFNSSIPEDFVPQPVRRADSMPHAASKERNKPIRSSTLRQTQTSDDYDDSPRTSARTSHQQPRKSSNDYSDERESPVRDPYRTEVRQPLGRRLTRSPSPLRPSELPRSASSRYPVQPPLSRTTSKQYAYPVPAAADILTSRPKLSRGNSGLKESPLFGEVPTTRSRDRDQYGTPLAADNVRHREMRPSIKVATGYTSSGRRTSGARSPSYYRDNSYNSPTVSA